MSKRKKLSDNYNFGLNEMDNFENPRDNKIRRGETQIDIRITRVGVNTGVALPVVLFGYQEQANAYNEILNIPAAVTGGAFLSSARFGFGNAGTTGAAAFDNGIVSSKNDTTFTYVVSGSPDVKDTLSISCPNYPYNSLLEAMASSEFHISRMRMSISDATQLTQFNEQIVVRRRSMFGRDESDRQTSQALKKPEQFQDGIIDLDVNINLNRATSIITNIIAVTNFTVTFSMWLRRIQKFNG